MANTTADKLAKLLSTRHAMKDAINGSGNTVGDVFSDYPAAVSNGRAGIAAAITEKGVQTPADASFGVLEENIRSIKSQETATVTLIKDVGSEIYFSFYDADGVFHGIDEDVNGTFTLPSPSILCGFSENDRGIVDFHNGNAEFAWTYTLRGFYAFSIKIFGDTAIDFIAF